MPAKEARKIVIHKSVGLTPYEIRHFRCNPDPNKREAPITFTKGAVLDVVPDLGPDDPIVKQTIPQHFADLWTSQNAGFIASNYTVEEMARATAGIQKENEQVAKALAEMEADE